MKYKSTKCVWKGETFDSIGERDRYIQLRLMERAGVIQNLRRQVKYELAPAHKLCNGRLEKSVSYVADFVYSRDGAEIVEDFKGFRPKEYILKRKWMYAKYGIEILETNRQS